MTTESKKLRTIITPDGSLIAAPGVTAHYKDHHPAMVSAYAAGHDARIAHEQREVIRRLHASLTLMRKLPTNERMLQGADEALAAAVPFLED